MVGWRLGPARGGLLLLGWLWVQQLPPQLAVPLLSACVERLGRGHRGANLKGGGGGASAQRGSALVVWVKAVLVMTVAAKRACVEKERIIFRTTVAGGGTSTTGRASEWNGSKRDVVEC